VDGLFTPGAPAAIREATKTTMLGTPQHVIVSAMKGMLDPAIWKEDKIEAPLLVVLARSPMWTDDYEAFVRGLAPHLDYHVMEGVGHFLMLEKPAEFNEILSGFLEKMGLIKPPTKP
jgi:sigma-B regulation protein RsbQ